MKVLGLLALPVAKNVARGAATTLYTATAPELAAKGGGYYRWLESGSSALDAVRPALQASTLMIVGAQTIFFSFFYSMLNLPRRTNVPGPSSLAATVPAAAEKPRD